MQSYKCGCCHPIQHFDQTSKGNNAQLFQMANGPGPTGYIFHRSSRKLVHPFGGSFNPENNTELVLHSSKDNPGRLQVRFVPVEGFGHFGYIEHVSSGKIVHPLGGSLTPENDTRLVYHSDRHAGALFAFDEEGEHIMHRDGKIWHPFGGSAYPDNNTPCVLHSDVHDAAKFYFGNLDGTEISPYPNPQLSGTWKIVKAFVTPKASHTFEQKYKVGKSLTRSSTERHAWSISASVAIAYFSASAEYSGYVEKSNSSTWSSEYEETTTIKVTAGKTVVVWQYVFGIEQYDEEYSFQSSIIGDTDSLDKHPTI